MPQSSLLEETMMALKGSTHSIQALVAQYCKYTVIVPPNVLDNNSHMDKYCTVSKHKPWQDSVVEEITKYFVNN